MGSYILTLYVTHQQEYAIQKLFSKRGWKFKKAEFKEVELPAIKPEDASDYSDSDVDGVEQDAGALVYQQGDIFVETNAEYATTDNSGVDRAQTASGRGNSTVTKPKVNIGDKGADRAAVSTENASEDTEAQTHTGSWGDAANVGDSFTVESNIKVEPQDDEVAESGDVVKHMAASQTGGALTTLKATAGSKPQKRKLTKSSKEEVLVSRKQQRRASASAKTLIKELAEDQVKEPELDDAQSDTAINELQDYKLEQTSDVEHSDEDYIPEDEKTLDNDDSESEMIPKKPAPADIDGDGYSKSLGGYFCRDCGNGFNLKVLFASHKHNNRCVFTCKHCKKQFNFKEYKKFLRHQKGHTLIAIEKNLHAKKKEILCHECGKSFQTYSGHRKHVQKNHSGKYPYNCEKCLKGFTEKHNYEAHMRRHSEIAMLVCDVCHTEFLYKCSLERHKRECKGNTLKTVKSTTFECDICGRIFSRKDVLKSHMDGIHSMMMQYSCAKCGKSYKWRSSFLNHPCHKH